MTYLNRIIRPPWQKPRNFRPPVPKLHMHTPLHPSFPPSLPPSLPTYLDRIIRPPRQKPRNFRPPIPKLRVLLLQDHLLLR